jgi:Flp pilus assembly protein TadG
MEGKIPKLQALARRRGSTSVQVLVILVPVLFGFLGFAIDLGRMYLIRAELKAAANAMALGAASHLIGTEASIASANSAGRLIISNADAFGNRYNFGGSQIGESDGFLNSDAPDPRFFDTAAGAIGEGDAASSPEAAGGATARHVRVDLTAESPLTFWGFLSLGQARKTPVAARAVAGLSAPLCQVCGIEPLVIPALDAADPVHFGYTPGSRYTLGYTCTGAPTPGILANTERRVEYLMINRYNTEATLFPDEGSQAFRIGAGGLPASSNTAQYCVNVNAEEQIWASAAPLTCNQQRPPTVAANLLCGFATRFDATVQTACQTIPESDTIASAYDPDTDVADVTDYPTYTGTGRRVITVGIVETLVAGGTMTILGFRQFLLEPAANDVTLTVSDFNGRFAALYIGSPMPLKAGRFGGCSITTGPGKVVLHQ